MEIFSHKEQESQEEGVWDFAPILKPSCISNVLPAKTIL